MQLPNPVWHGLSFLLQKRCASLRWNYRSPSQALRRPEENKYALESRDRSVWDRWELERRFQLRSHRCLPVGMVALALLGVALSPTLALSLNGATNQTEVKDKYDAIEVGEFEAQSGVQFPADHLANLQKEIIRELSRSKEFQRVLPLGDTSPSSDVRVLRLSGTITYSGKGGQASLAISGVTSGQEMDAQLFFADSSTKETIHIAEVRASLKGNPSLDDTIREFAKQTAIKAKLVLNLRVAESNPPGTPPASPAGMPAGVTPAEIEHRVVSISAKDWAGAQQQLTQSVSTGYRVAGLARTGKYTADVKLEKVDAPGAYQYRILHPIRASSLQKDMNQYAADGFRVVAHTLTDLGYWTTVIMERPPTPASATYLYLVDESRRVSAAQRNVSRDQDEGYTLVDQSDHGALHMLLFEKVVQDKKN